MLCAFYLLPDLDARIQLVSGCNCSDVYAFWVTLDPLLKQIKENAYAIGSRLAKLPVGKILGYVFYLNAYTFGPVSNVETYTRLNNTNILLDRLAMLNNIRV